MPQKALIIAIFALLNTWMGLSQTITLREAVEQKMVDCKITGSWDSNDSKDYLDADGQYYGKCMTLTLRNRSNENIEIWIENGLMLMCEDTLVQDMVVTKPQYIALDSREGKVFELYAMCSEIHDGMPAKNKKYRVGKKAKKELVKITQVINEMFMHNVVGQGAVWAFTDGASEDDLRMYGATDESLVLTIEVLNRAKVYTAINPEKEEEPVVEDTTVATEGEGVKKKLTQSKGITIDWLYVFIIGGLILLLIVYSVYMTVRKRK